MRLNKSIKPVLVGLCIVLTCNDIKAQNSSGQAKDTSIKVDLLRAPSSPASNLLGISPSDIEKPTDITGFMASLKNSTNNFTAIPSNYAFDLAPFQLFNRTRALDSKTLVENKENFRRSFVVSFGIKKEEKNDSVAGSKPKTGLGIGFKFAIKRSPIDSNSKQAFNNIWNYQVELNEKQAQLIKSIKNKDSLSIESSKATLVQMFRNGLITRAQFEEQTRILNGMLDNLEQHLFDSMQTDQTQIGLIKKKISEEVKKIKIERQGFNLDFAAGAVIDFIDNDFDNSRVFKVGSWLTGGWNKPEKNSSTLFILRYLYNPKTSLADPNLNLENLHTLDFGGRLIFTAMEKKLLFSGEAIYRSILNKASATSSWRLMVNAEYEIGINQKLTFSFGRNFDGTTYKSGNVLGAINLLLGFGNTSVGAFKPSN